MYFWVDEPPRIVARGENISMLTRAGRPMFNMTRRTALRIARDMLAAVQTLEDRAADPPAELQARSP